MFQQENVPIKESSDAEVARVHALLEEFRLFRESAAAFADPSRKDSLGLRFQETAERLGERTAIIFEGRSCSWREFNSLANQYAHALAELGVRRGDRVSIHLENRLELLFATIATIKLGAAAAMVNHQLGGRALEHSYRLIDSDWCVFGQESTSAVEGIRSHFGPGKHFLFVANEPGVAAPAWAIDFGSLAARSADTNPPITREITQGECCFLLFTSGTTGLPKMSVVAHQRSMSSGAATGKLVLKSTEEDRIYLTLPLCHGVGLGVGFCSTIFTGASLVLRRRFSASQFLEDIRQHGVSTFIYIGELCRYILAQPEREDDADNPLRVIVGNGLRPDIWMKFKERFGISQIGESYGASEGNIVLLNLLYKDFTIGTPMGELALVAYDVDNDEIRRDADGRCVTVEAGRPGLMISRIMDGSRFDGYTDPQATEKKIVRDAFADGDCWFNSGDLLREVNVGYSAGLKHYQFVDRAGDTFRWKGENVATSQVGEIINGFDQVDFCNVYGVTIPGTEGRAGMAAIKLAPDVKSIDLCEFSRFVRESLSHFARPVFLRIRQEIDITGTFKMVKNQLQREGYDPGSVQDPLYVMLPGGERYEMLTGALYADIMSTRIGF